jgi:mRNA-degrading endonuclease YafQ of YafQ-DinJ toxin-antitoxin module
VSARVLVPTAAFTRAAKRLAKRRPEAAEALRGVLAALAADAFAPALRTHKLQRELAGSWACSAGYDLRVVFAFAEHEGAEAVVLESVGTHDEVY